jgi:integrase
VLVDYRLAAITPDLVAGYRDQRLEEGLSASTERLEFALLSQLYTVAIKEWRIRLVYNPVVNIRKPPPHRGRDWRLSLEEEKKLLRACDKHSNPMLGQIVRLALYTGTRAGENRTLRRSQVNLESGDSQIRYESTQSGNDAVSKADLAHCQRW